MQIFKRDFWGRRWYRFLPVLLFLPISSFMHYFNQKYSGTCIISLPEFPRKTTRLKSKPITLQHIVKKYPKNIRHLSLSFDQRKGKFLSIYRPNPVLGLRHRFDSRRRTPTGSVAIEKIFLDKAVVYYDNENKSHYQNNI